MEAMAQLFKALADPTRLRILHFLGDREQAAGAIARALAMSPSAVSHQLAFLHGSRILRRRRAGRSVFYALDDDHVRALFAQGLEHATHV
jgi:DNA-binding transcriptional ArsR family regulator